LGVAKAISAHLELSDVLEALVVQLKPMVHFDSIAVVVLDGIGDARGVRRHFHSGHRPQLEEIGALHAGLREDGRRRRKDACGHGAAGD